MSIKLEGKLPHIKKPCANCPFKKDTLKGWLGAERMRGVLGAETFVCHKKTDMQCAGHMLIKGEGNAFVLLAKRLGILLKLTGRDQVFDTEEACISHHANSRDTTPIDPSTGEPYFTIPDKGW